MQQHQAIRHLDVRAERLFLHTAAVLADLVLPDFTVVAPTGTSGAGKKLATGFLASEVMLFGSLFAGYILLRTGNPAWGAGSELLSVPMATLNTAVLILGVGLGVTLLGVGLAWLVTMCHVPSRGILEWALLLPHAVPTYNIGYTYTDLLQYAGPVQTAIRDITGWHVREYWFPEIRSLPGAAAMLSFALYPYVYLLARSAFLDQSRTTLEAARLAGYGAWGRFWHVALPLARTGIVAGTALALMETLADFGTVSYFAVNTFTTGIYRAWLSLGDPVAAGQLASCLLVFVLAMLTLERTHRGGAQAAAVVRPRRRCGDRPDDRAPPADLPEPGEAGRHRQAVHRPVGEHLDLPGQGDVQPGRGAGGVAGEGELGLPGEVHPRGQRQRHQQRHPGQRGPRVGAEPLRDVDEWLGRFRRFWTPPLMALETELVRGRRRARQTADEETEP